MIKLINKKGKIDKVVIFIGHPITEMVCAFIINFSRQYFLGFMRPFTGSQLDYILLVSILVITPWIMLGHGAIRYIRNTDKAFVDISNKNISKSKMQKGNLNLLSSLLVAFFVIGLLAI